MQAVSETSLVVAPRRTAPNRFFAVPPRARRDRRPTDITMLIVSAVLVWVFATRATNGAGRFERSLTDLVASLPAFLDPVWAIANDALRVWAVVLVIAALWRRRWGLLRDVAAGIVLSAGAVMAIGRLANGSWPDVSTGLSFDTVNVEYPALGLALAVAVVSIASSHLSRPYRYLCRWIIGLGGVGAFALGAGTPSGVIGAVYLGLGVAALVHLVFGSPGGLPSVEHVRGALEGVGVDAGVIDISRQSGVVRVRAITAGGNDLDVKIYGRDAWDGQLIVSVWRFLWYRDGGQTLRLSRLQQVEHEAFLTLLAERRGAQVHPVLAAGVEPAGDALLVVERLGTPIGEVGVVPHGLGVSMWRSLDELHRAGITHGSIDLDRVFLADGTVRFADLAAGDTTSSPAALLVDRAQLLAVTTAVMGADAAVACALEALGAAGLADVTSYLQPAAMSPRLRRELAARSWSPGETMQLRKAARTAGASLHELLVRDAQAALNAWLARHARSQPDMWTRFLVPVYLGGARSEPRSSAPALGVALIERRVRSLGRRARLLQRAHEDMEFIRARGLARAFRMSMLLRGWLPGQIARYCRRAGARSTLVLSNLGKVFARGPLVGPDGGLTVPGAELTSFAGWGPCRPGTSVFVVTGIYRGAQSIWTSYDPGAMSASEAEDFAGELEVQLRRSLAGE
jgi:hypothetical protein